MNEYSDRQKAILFLNYVAGLTSAKIHKLIDIAPTEELIASPARYRDKITAAAGEAVYDKIKLAESRMINAAAEKLQKSNASIIINGDREYPQLLKEIALPPAILYYKGDIDLLRTSIIGVVGTREPSRYGAEVTITFVSGLVKAGLTVASGLARGIDSVAHRAALEEGGKTLAVLGCGIDKVYPSDNAPLYRQIEEKGLIISEYPPGTAPSAFQFPERNRIISGVSQGILLTEAGLKSGSLITADCAIEQNRRIFVTPSNVTSQRGAGGNKLLKKLQGAIVLQPDDILEELGLQQQKIDTTPMQLDFTEAKIAEALSYGEMHFDELMTLTGLGVSALSSLLTKLELLQAIKKLDNNYYGV